MEFFGQEDASASPPDASPSSAPSPGAPLADRMRPRRFEDWVGQEDLTGPDAFLTRLLKSRSIPSLIFWGPPGCGKTTLALLIARASGLATAKLSAVTAGIKDAKAIMEEAAQRLRATGRKTILFVDEIHRFNKAQQDAFLPHVESGVITLFGATTENPSFTIISALLSRCRVLTLGALEGDDLLRILRRALGDTEAGLAALNLEAADEALEAIASVTDGDARRALNLLEQCAAAARVDEKGRRVLDSALIAEVSRRTHLLYDKTGEEHFNLISALHKSLRASDAQAALYWLARMLAGGEEPLYVGRRLVRFATEDVGLADPQALPQALAAVESYRMLGSPEGELALVQATIYLATCPKSNSLYQAWKNVSAEIEQTGSLPAPIHLRNAPTGLMKGLGYGKDYAYDHDAPDHFSGQPCLPEQIAKREFYSPGPFGYEKEIAKRLEWWEKRRREIESGP
jgi:putative ATPase